MTLRHPVSDRWLRRRLVQLREELGLSQAEAAKLAGIGSARTLIRIETQRNPRSPLDHDKLMDLCAAYQVSSAEEKELTYLRRRAAQTAWWDEYADILRNVYAEHCELEQEAHKIDVCVANTYSGWLQTEEYGLLVQSVTPEVDQPDRRVQLRLERGRRMISTEKEIRILIDEGVLRRELPAGVLDAQLDHIMDLEDKGLVAVRWMPITPHSLMMSNFQLHHVRRERIVCVAVAWSEVHLEASETTDRISTYFEQWWAQSHPLSKFKRLTKE